MYVCIHMYVYVYVCVYLAAIAFTIEIYPRHENKNINTINIIN